MAIEEGAVGEAAEATVAQSLQQAQDKAADVASKSLPPSHVILVRAVHSQIHKVMVAVEVAPSAANHPLPQIPMHQLLLPRRTAPMFLTFLGFREQPSLCSL